MFSWRNLLTSDYWFSVDRVLVGRGVKLAALVGAILIILSIAAWLATRSKTMNRITVRAARRFGVWAFWIGVLTLAWAGLRYQYVYVLGTRAALALIVIIAAAWLFPIARYMIRSYPVEMAAAAKQQLKDKYL
jgi:hypothetical protein